MNGPASPSAHGPPTLPGPLVLASASPRRRDLLPLLGIPFEAVEPAATELDRGDPDEVVVENAVRKARAGIELAAADAVVIGCDTDVVCDGEVLGKPEDAEGARARLRSLSGREHEVLSGVAVLCGARLQTALARTVVGFADLGEAEIEGYVATGEWQGRAGGYAVQGLGSALIRRVDGDLSSVIGLPMGELRRMLDRLRTD